MLMLSRSAVIALSLTWVAACGGQSELTGGDESAGEGGGGGSGATGGTSRGGTTSTGGSGAALRCSASTAGSSV